MGDVTMADKKTASPGSWGRAVDYLLGRNTLIGVASLMLLLISGFATWHGMRDFIIGVSTSPAANSQQLPGGMSFSNDFLVIIVVFALTFLMWLCLRETFGERRRFTDRLVTFPLYVFLAIWSIGFGYGFWWSLIAGEEATRTGLSGLQQDAGDAAGAVAARLDAVKVQLDSVVTWSESQMAREETSGGSCGTSSGAGRGPLYAARVSVRDQIASLRNSVQTSWLAPVQADIESLQKSVAQLQGDDRRRASAELRCHGEQHPHARPRHRRPLQRARQVDGDRDARDRGFVVGGAGTERVHLPRPDTGAAPDAGGRPGRSAGDAEPARGLIQRRPGRRRQRHQASCGRTSAPICRACSATSRRAARRRARRRTRASRSPAAI